MAARVLVVGDSMVDRAYYGTATRLAQEGPVPVVAVTHADTYAGGAANVAENLRALLPTVTLAKSMRLLSAAPTDSELQRLVRCDATWVRTLRDTVKTRLWAGTRMLARYDQDYNLLFEESDSLTDEFFALYADYDIIVFSDYGRGALRDIDEMLYAATQRGKYTIVDPKGSNWTKYAGAHVIKANDKEMDEACDFHECDPEDLCAKVGVENVVVTQGEEPTLVFNKVAQCHKQAAHAAPCVDPVGAGDSFLAGVVSHLAVADNLDLADLYAAVATGNAAGAAAVTKQGTHRVTTKDIANARRLPVND